MYNALMWTDCTCIKEQQYEFSTKTELNYWNKVSIRWSLCFLRKQVWNSKSKRRQGYCSRQFIRSAPIWNRETEKRLRHSVQYWQKRAQRDAVQALALPLELKEAIAQWL